MSRRVALLAAALLGGLAVAAGAFGAHGLASRVDEHALEIWKTGAHYQLLHAVALVGVAGLPGSWGGARRVAAVLFTVGSVVFAGTLYAMTLGGPKILGAVTPLGGVCLIAGWVSLLVHAWRTTVPDRS